MGGSGSAPKRWDTVWTRRTKEYVFGRASRRSTKIGLVALMRGEPEKTGAVEPAYFPVQARKSRFRRVVLQFHKCVDRNPVGKRRDPVWIPAHKFDAWWLLATLFGFQRTKRNFLFRLHHTTEEAWYGSRSLGMCMETWRLGIFV